MPETCPRRIVGESARTRLRDFRGELDLWTERGPVSFVPRSFQAMGKLRCVMGEGRRGGKRKNDTLTRFDVSRSGISSLDYIRIGVCIIIDNNVSVGAWFFFVGSTDYFTLGRRGRAEKLAGRCQKKFFTRARRHNALSSFQSY